MEQDISLVESACATHPRRRTTTQNADGEGDIHNPPQHPDVDGRWAWVIFGCCFCTFIVLGGLLYTGGIFYVAMLEHFRETHSYTAWMGSLMGAFYMLGGPLAAKFIQHKGCRCAMLLASVMMCTGYFVSAFASSFELVLLFYGVVLPTGMCLAYSSSVIVINDYFDRYHALAISLAMTGNGVGLFFMSQILEYVTRTQGWRLAFMFCSGLSLQLAILGSLFFPLKGSKCNNASVQLTTDKVGLSCQESKTATKNGKIYAKIVETNQQSPEQNCIQSENCILEHNTEVKFSADTNLEFWKNYFESSLLRLPSMWYLSLSSMLLQMSTLAFYVVYKNLFSSLGQQDHYATGLSIIGVSDVIGRIVTGFLCSYEKVNTLVLYGLSMACLGCVLSLHLVPMASSSHLYLLGLSAAFGFLYSMTNVLLAVVPARLFGRRHLPEGLGYMLFWGGTGALIGAPLAGLLVDWSGTYTAAMTFTGAVCCAAGLCLIPVYFCRTGA